MGLLAFSYNVMLDGCVDHREGIADDESHDYFTRLMNAHGAMLWGRVTYELMEEYWPDVAGGDIAVPPALLRWAQQLEAKPKYVASCTRTAYSWNNSHLLRGELRACVLRLKEQYPDGVLLGSGKLATALDRMELIDEYHFLIHPVIAGHGPTLYETGLQGSRHLELISAQPLSSGAIAASYRRVR